MTVNIVPSYVYGSPRYHAILPAITPYVEDDYGLYDTVNGTYDKYWPLYALTETEAPSYKLVSHDGTEVTLKGDLALYLFRNDYTKTIGSKDYANLFVNSNLDKVSVSFSTWLGTKLNPGWSNIQTFSSTSVSGFVIRALGTTATVAGYHAVTLEKTGSQSTSVNFPVGIIVTYEESTYKCVKSTSNYPSPVSSDWVLMDGVDDVFNADYFVINSDGNTVYVKNITDTSRQFVPDDKVVTWNIGACVV